MDSPYHSLSQFTPRDQALLLQFTLTAVIKKCKKSLDRHLQLFPQAFPGIEVPRRGKTLSRLKPYLHHCRNDEGLWLFLLKHAKSLGPKKRTLAFLQELYQEDLAKVGLRMSGHFTMRGFTRAAKECILLLHRLG